MDPSTSYVIGIDFGTLSGRAVVVRVSDGEELGSGVLDYPHAVLEETLPDGAKLPPDWALQVPADYIEVLKRAVPDALADAGVDPAQVIGVGIDFTACTLVPVLEDGTPLNELPEYAGRRHAYVKLWKHHAAQQQADRINRLAAERDESWRARYGGLLSSEWSMAKGLQLLEEDREIYDRMWRYVEASDWLVWQLGGQFTRNTCTAGYKNNWQDAAYPDKDFLATLNADFADYFTAKIDGPIAALGSVAGHLTAEAAAWTGLPEGIPIAAGNVDAHVACPAVQAVEPGQMTAIMGTSACQIVNDAALHTVPGMCGVVDGGVIDGLYGYEAGQSGVGDIFAWFVKNAVPAATVDAAKAAGVSIHEHLTALAAAQAVGEHGLVCLDWISGNRSVLVNHELSGVILGLTLTTKPEDIYRALIEATAFGTRVIIEAFTCSGVAFNELVVGGGLKRNALLMQIYADVLRLPLSVATSEQGCALGSAIHAAVAAGAYHDVKAASDAMGRKEYAAFTPDETRAVAYDALFAEYVQLHDYFGRGANDVMRRLKAIKREARA